MTYFAQADASKMFNQAQMPIKIGTHQVKATNAQMKLKTSSRR
jgi:hypothetical protein